MASTSNKVTFLFNSDLLKISSKEAQIIAHQCNCKSKKAVGLAADIFKKFPYSNCYSSRDQEDEPGTIKYFGKSKENQRYVMAMYAQLNPGKPKGKDNSKQREKWFMECLDKISGMKKIKSIAFPYGIGCGKGGGDWDNYEHMIVDWANNNPKIKTIIVSQDSEPEDISDSEQEEVSEDEVHEEDPSESEQEDDSPESDEEVHEDPSDSDSEKEDDSPESDEEVDKEDPSDSEQDVQKDKDVLDMKVKPRENIPLEKDPRFFPLIWEEIVNCPYINEQYILLLVQNKVNGMNECLKEAAEVIKSKMEDGEQQTLEEHIDVFTPKGWKKFFDQEKDTLKEVSNFVDQEIKSGKKVYPPIGDVFAAFEYCSPKKIKVVIIGQDPYPTPGAAMGLAFSHHPDRNRIQPSLKNIFTEMKNDGFKPGKTGDLTKWTENGVFLINTALTVREGAANSHKDEWTYFTRRLFKYLNENCKKLVVIAWGTPAQKLSTTFKSPHKIISSVHPSPLSADKGFFGSKPFTKTNTILEKWGVEPIDWNLV